MISDTDLLVHFVCFEVSFLFFSISFWLNSKLPTSTLILFELDIMEKTLVSWK